MIDRITAVLAIFLVGAVITLCVAACLYLTIWMLFGATR